MYIHNTDFQRKLANAAATFSLYAPVLRFRRTPYNNRLRYLNKCVWQSLSWGLHCFRLTVLRNSSWISPRGSIYVELCLRRNRGLSLVTLIRNTNAYVGLMQTCGDRRHAYLALRVAKRLFSSISVHYVVLRCHPSFDPANPYY